MLCTPAMTFSKVLKSSSLSTSLREGRCRGCLGYLFLQEHRTPPPLIKYPSTMPLWLVGMARNFLRQPPHRNIGGGISKFTLQQNSHLCMSFLGIARPHSQFPHSCVCERFISSQDRSTCRSWEYINRTQKHECGNWDCGRAVPFSRNFCFEFSTLILCSVGVSNELYTVWCTSCSIKDSL